MSIYKKTSFFDRSQYAIPNIITASRPNTNHVKKYLVFYPQGKQFLTKADYVVFSAQEGRYEIPYEMLKNIATNKFKLIDEEQFVVDELNVEEYAGLITSIETELGKVIDESMLKEKYAQYSLEDLDDEFNRIRAIPNARVKIFALIRMSALIAEYDARGLQMPDKRTSNPTTAATSSEPLPSIPKARTQQKQQRKQTPKKTWWKFW